MSSWLSWKCALGVRNSRPQRQQRNKKDCRPVSDNLQWTEKLKGVDTQCEHPLITISEAEDLFEGEDGNSQKRRSFILKKHNQCQRSVEVCLTPTCWSSRRFRGTSGLFYFLFFKASLLHNSIFCDKLQFIYATIFLSGYKKPLVKDAFSRTVHPEKMEERRMKNSGKKGAAARENFTLQALKPNYYSKASRNISNDTQRNDSKSWPNNQRRELPAGAKALTCLSWNSRLEDN